MLSPRPTRPQAYQNSLGPKDAPSGASFDSLQSTIPSFQDFLRRTPPLDYSIQRHLQGRSPSRCRTESVSSFQSSAASSERARRSSSVYSRTLSGWPADTPSWADWDFANESRAFARSELAGLQPLAFSSSTPQLVERPLTPPRRPSAPHAGSPMPLSPVSMTGQSRAPSPPNFQPSVLLPSPPVSLQLLKGNLRVVPLEQATAAASAHGAARTLPEELRAMNPSRSKSQGCLRTTSDELISSQASIDEMPVQPTLIDSQGRQRSIYLPRLSVVETSPPRSPRSTSVADIVLGMKGVARGPEKQMIPLTKQARQESRIKAEQILGLREGNEPRGRARQRGPRHLSYAHYLPSATKAFDDEGSDADEQTDARQIAQQYHALLSAQYRQPSDPHVAHVRPINMSDETVKIHMKLVPPPLFQGRQLPLAHSTLKRADSAALWSPYRLSTDASASLQESSISRHGDPFPLKISVTPTTSSYSHRRVSTSGSIPISPPPATIALYSPLTPPVDERPSSVLSHTVGRPNEGRASAYYPYVASRGTRKTHVRMRSGNTAQSMGRSRNRISSQKTSPSRLATSTSPHKAKRTTSPEASAAARLNRKRLRRLAHGAAKGAAKGAARYAEYMRRLSDVTVEPYAIRRPSSTSPHLLPSPIRTTTNASSTAQTASLRLGWSDNAKAAHDNARFSGSSWDRQRDDAAKSSLLEPPPLTPSTTRTTATTSSSRTPTTTKRTNLHVHTAMPARPLDERPAALGAEQHTSLRRRSSIFSSLLDGWRENKAERRREELRRIIKVVPREDGTPGGDSGRPGLIERPIVRRLSAFQWS